MTKEKNNKQNYPDEDEIDFFMSAFFDKLENKYPKLEVVRGINNKETYFYADNVHDLLEEYFDFMRGDKSIFEFETEHKKPTMKGFYTDLSEFKKDHLKVGLNLTKKMMWVWNILHLVGYIFLAITILLLLTVLYVFFIRGCG